MNTRNINTPDKIPSRTETNQPSTKSRSSQKEQTKLQQSSFNDYAQLNLKHIEYLISLNRLNPNALSIFLFILKNMDCYNALVCSQAMLMEYFSLSRSTINRCIADLKKHGFIYITKTGSSNVYLANDNLVWKSPEPSINCCKFPANVILSLSEQDRHYKNHDSNIQKNKTPSKNTTEATLLN